MCFMPEPRRAAEKAHKCDIEGCKEEAERSISRKKLEKAGMGLSGEIGSSAHLCRTHYREFKKKTKDDRTYERLGW